MRRRAAIGLAFRGSLGTWTKAPSIAGEDLRDQIVSRIEEIRRRARAEGYPF
jgi:hypothetical protein